MRAIRSTPAGKGIEIVLHTPGGLVLGEPDRAGAAQPRRNHDHPLMASELERLGLPVRVGVPAEERALMYLYPQPRGRETGVEYVPGRPLPPGLPPGRQVPRRRRGSTGD